MCLKKIKKIYLEYMYFRSNLLCLQIIRNTDNVNYQNLKKHFSILEDWLIMYFSKIEVWKFNNFFKICHKNQKYSHSIQKQTHNLAKHYLSKNLPVQSFSSSPWAQSYIWLHRFPILIQEPSLHVNSSSSLQPKVRNIY